MSNTESKIDSVLAKRIGWFVAVATFLWGIVTQIIIPINTLKVQQDQIYAKLVELSQNADGTNQTVTAVKSQVDTNTQAIKDLQVQVNKMELKK